MSNSLLPNAVANHVALSWSDELLVGYPLMDHRHEEFIACLGDLQRAPDAILLEVLDAMIHHLTDHFGEEDRWMEESGFPPRKCHMDEHAAVLNSAVEVRSLLVDGDAAPCRRLSTALEDWFPGHAIHLDSALAHWMCKAKLGGKPVVLRRRT
jgi:hemerythrin-like metal-binding protein